MLARGRGGRVSLREYIDDARDGKPVETLPQSDAPQRRVWRGRRNWQTQALAARTGAPWQDSEIETITDPTKTAMECASELGRTWESIVRKRSRVKLKR